MSTQTASVDYYEFLQISPNADHDTIHRVYRFLAARFHPDNPETGNVGKFNMLRTAYEVLSDPLKRAEYDAACQREPVHQQPLSKTVDFMDDMEGELNRRVAVLAVLYFRRRANPYAPEVPLADIEKRMGFPRDYLDFTTWYLTRKGYVTRADNSDFTLTAAGVDFVETQRVQIPILNRLLTANAESGSSEQRTLDTHSAGPDASDAPMVNTNPVIVLPNLTRERDRGNGKVNERRLNFRDRRINARDPRVNGVERRISGIDRRQMIQ
jgi:hypothetical protein